MTRDQKIYRWAYLVACFTLSMTLFLGYSNIIYPADFALAVYRFHLLPASLINSVAIYLPWLEVICAVCLLAVPRFKKAALWIILLMLISFTVAIGINLHQGTPYGCGCFSRDSASSPMGWDSIIRNIALILMTLFALIAQRLLTRRGSE